MKGRTVRIYLVDGSPTGVMTAEIMNWTGRFTVAPRNQLADLLARDEIKRTGLYILAGDNPMNPAQEIVYIGESDNIRERLLFHNNKDRGKDFWVRTVVVTSKDENLTKAHVRYLEARLIRIATDAKRCKLGNGTAPDVPILPEPDIADMEYFLDQVQMLLPVLGFSFAKPALPGEIGGSAKLGAEAAPMFQIAYSGVSAFARQTADEFVVLEGSTVRRHETLTLGNSYRKARAQLIEDGVLSESSDTGYWKLTQNVPFTSPSTAASVVCGATLNGRIHWMVQGSKQTYAQWQELQLGSATGGQVEKAGLVAQ